jgi:hypothetical protein
VERVIPELLTFFQIIPDSAAETLKPAAKKNIMENSHRVITCLA